MVLAGPTSRLWLDLPPGCGWTFHPAQAGQDVMAIRGCHTLGVHVGDSLCVEMWGFFPPGIPLVTGALMSLSAKAKPDKPYGDPWNAPVGHWVIDVGGKGRLK